MYCSHCAAQLPDDAKFCHKCAKPTVLNTEAPATPIRPVQQRAPSAPPPPSTGSLALRIVACLVIGLFIGGFALMGIITGFWRAAPSRPPSVSNIADQTSVQSAPARKNKDIPAAKPTIADQPRSIVNSSFHVDASAMKYYQFELNRDATLSGKFSAEGGSNDIDCLVVDADNFENVKNGTAGRALFQSGYTTRSEIDISLTAGKYVLVFDNRKAIMTSKTVTANIVVK